jgi:integrase/recombinase XerD
MAQAKVISEQGLKRALGIATGDKHAARDRLALLLTHWAGMRVCEVAALSRATVLGPAGEILEGWRLDRGQTKGSMGRVVDGNSKPRKEWRRALRPDWQHCLTLRSVAIACKFKHRRRASPFGAKRDTGWPQHNRKLM